MFAQFALAGRAERARQKRHLARAAQMPRDVAARQHEAATGEDHLRALVALAVLATLAAPAGERLVHGKRRACARRPQLALACARKLLEARKQLRVQLLVGIAQIAQRLVAIKR